jgi:hypothetical protein
MSRSDGSQQDAVEALPATTSVELRYIATRRLIRRYTREGAALAFVRDVVRLGSREQAARFELVVVDESSGQVRVTEGAALVKRALEDSVL